MIIEAYTCILIELNFNALCKNASNKVNKIFTRGADGRTDVRVRLKRCCASKKKVLRGSIVSESLSQCVSDEGKGRL